MGRPTISPGPFPVSRPHLAHPPGQPRRRRSEERGRPRGARRVRHDSRRGRPLPLPERLEAQAELASARPDLDILTSDAYLEVGGRDRRTCYGDDWSFDVKDQRAAILERNFIFGLAAVRRRRLLAVGGFDETLPTATDWDCWIRLILSGSAAGLVAEPLPDTRSRHEPVGRPSRPLPRTSGRSGQDR